VLTAFDATDLSACSVSDALDAQTGGGILDGIHAMTPCGVVIGFAFTVTFEEGPGPFNEYLSSVPPHSVLILDGGGRTDLSLWGAIISTEAHRLEMSGTLINGACRDLTELAEITYPVFARGRTPRSGRGAVHTVGVDVPLSIGGVSVNPRDLIVADRDGVVIVPHRHAEQVLNRARRITRRDEAIRERVRSGLSLKDARSSLPI
jgi:regulator of RNase E activity RraA